MGKLIHDTRRSFILALAAVLLELELEDEVVVKNTDIDDFQSSKVPSLYLALVRVLNESTRSLELKFRNIIDSCLDMYHKYQAREGGNYIRNIQAELFTKVVFQLQELYEVKSDSAHSTAPITQKKKKNVDVNFGTITQTLPVRTAGRPLEMIPEVSSSSIMTESLTTPSLLPPPQLPGPSDSLLLASTGMISSSRVWLEMNDGINRYLTEFQKRCPEARKVKIAIFDTGCDLDAPCLVSLENSEPRLRNHWHDWSGNSKIPIDEDPKIHGTALVALLLRVVYHAEVFVGRIAKNKNELAKAEGNISKAISHAATDWDVDIVTMSFGFEKVVKTIREALDEAIRVKRKKGKEILFFAAANNDGLNSKELFPASFEHVISVRGTDHTGEFLKKYNPAPWPTNKSSLFGTFGNNIPYDYGDSKNAERTKSGCSIATSILAGIVATIIQYVNYAAEQDDTVSARLLSKESVLRVLHHITDDDPRRYVAPWKFFKRNEGGRLALVRTAIADLQEHE